MLAISVELFIQILKKNNILYAQTGALWLIDFDDSLDEPEQTDAMCKGTMAYWSPEVCQLNADANSFPRDMWAFGVVIQQLVYPEENPFSTAIDPDYDGFDIDKARASSLLKSMQQFINNNNVDGNLVWPFLLSKNQKKLEYSDHVKLQELLSGLWKILPSERWSSTRTLIFLENQVHQLKNNGKKLQKTQNAKQNKIKQKYEKN